MEARWITDNYSYKRLILAADVGGTNANIGLVAVEDRKFVIIAKCLFKTEQVKNFADCLMSAIKYVQEKDSSLKPDMCCISAAGPVNNNRCKLSNSPLVVDGGEIERTIGIKTLLINDFSAISYSLPLLDVNNPAQITPLRHTDGSLPAQTGNVRAVAGAGTGMGVGFLVEDDGRYIACASEGGHIAFSSFDSQTRELHEYMAKQFGELMEAELFVSGSGIKNMFYYFKDVKKAAMAGVLKDIDDACDSDKPALIAAKADSNEICNEIMKLFVKCYGRFAGDVAAMTIPTMGLYLAGGIVTKNEKYFVENNQFMRYFDDCFHPNIKKILKTIPVYIIRDYSVSLYGAANAACCLMQ